MKYLVAASFVLSFNFSFAQDISIIPKPVEMILSNSKEKFTINKQTKFVFPHGYGLEKFADYFNEYLLTYYGFKLQVYGRPDSKTTKNIIQIWLSPLPSNDTIQGKYNLKVTKDYISLSSPRSSSGLFYGIQTLIQLLPIQNPKNQTLQLSIPQLSITDYPRFAYRGLHLDVSRHFFPISYIKTYIDYIALHKMNYFHWHLTDDQGWRIEIKKYPKLTSVGAWRDGTIIGRYPGTGNDSIHYGGFYTQEQIKEVVAYAAKRYITVIPEIEMPGHSMAALAAYPQLSTTPDSVYKVAQTWGINDVFNNVLNPSEYTFKFLQDVLDEVMKLFPSPYIHIGGDECSKKWWHESAFCQQLMKEKGIKDEHGLQSYFIQRIEKYVNSKGKKIIGWDEILEGGLAPNATVMSWQGEKGGIEAAKQSHDVIMTPGNPVYFDHSQSQNEDSVTIGGYNPLENVYAYEPIPKELNEEEGKHVLGAQANMWTEYIGNTKKVEYTLFPRLSALSEVLWSPKEKRDPIAIGWSDFEKRLLVQFKRYDLWKVNYSKAYFDLKTSVLPGDDNNSVKWEIKSKLTCEYCDIMAAEEFTYEKDTDVYDTTARYDDKDISKITSYVVTKKMMEAGSKGYRGITGQNEITIPINESKNIKVWQRMHHSKGQTISQSFYFNKATGKQITLNNPASDKYPGDGAFTLVNGVQNEKGFAKSLEFLGFNGTDCDALINLGNFQFISAVKIHALSRKSSWIWQPQTVEVYGSPDGQYFSKLGSTSDFIESENGTGNGTMTVTFIRSQVNYVRVIIKNWGTIPENNPGAGSKPWLFVDEIEVN